MLHGLVIIIEKLTGEVERAEKTKVGAVFGHVYTLLVVMLGWMMFRADSLGALWTYLKAFLGIGGVAFADSQFAFFIREYAVALAVAVLCSTPAFKNFEERAETVGGRQAAVVSSAGWIAQIILFAVSMSFLVMNSYNPFIYFNF